MLNLDMQFMVVICKNCSNNFLKLKLGEKLANLMNYTLDMFITKRGLKLKINNMKVYEFDPKFILVSLVSIYSGFEDSNEFLEFVAKDTRSFKIENFEKVISKKGKVNFNYKDIISLEKICKKLKDISSQLKAKEINYDDAPEEFLDQITTELMEDPVKLPSSGTIVDRTCIETHLQSDPMDPFNRSKLTKDMLIPLPELKQRIEEYKLKKKQEHELKK